MAKGYGKMAGRGGGMGNMRNQIQDLQRQMAEEQEKLAQTETSATVGGGAVKIVMTGDQVCKSVTIDPDFLKDADAETMQEMMLSCINMALEQSKKMQEDGMGALTGGLSGLGLGF